MQNVAVHEQFFLAHWELLYICQGILSHCLLIAYLLHCKKCEVQNWFTIFWQEFRLNSDDMFFVDWVVFGFLYDVI